jgi:hypothetical protein
MQRIHAGQEVDTVSIVRPEGTHIGKDCARALVAEAVLAASPNHAGYHTCKIPSFRKYFLTTS